MIELKWIEAPMSVCRTTAWAADDQPGRYVFAARTPQEYSLVCETAFVPGNVTVREDGWRMFRVCGTMEFSLVGILAGISGVLAASGIALFVVSTFDTDYVLVKEAQHAQAEEALRAAGYLWQESEA